MTATRRQLVLLRHAKSAWPDGVSDLGRPLTERGQRDAAAVGRWLQENVDGIDAVACSPAQRTRETWALVSAELADQPAVSIEDRIYAAEPHELLAVVHDLPDTAAGALLVGHNPGMEELVELLSGKQPGMSTSAVAVLTWEGGWADAAARVAELRDHMTPRG